MKNLLYDLLAILALTALGALLLLAMYVSS